MSKMVSEEYRLVLCLVVGNTVMCHLFARKYPLYRLGPAILPQSYFGVHDTGGGLESPDRNNVYIAPAVSGYIGGDITADLLAALDEAECVEDWKRTIIDRHWNKRGIGLGEGRRFFLLCSCGRSCV